MGPAESRGGTFTPAAVQGAAGDVRAGDIGELARIGPLLREPPQSGTAPRALAQYALTGIPSSGAGAALGYSEGGSEGALAGAGIGLLAPFVASRVMTNPAVQNYLSTSVGDPRQQAMLGALLRAGAISLPTINESANQ